MFGEGITQGRPVASKYMSRRQPSIGITSRSAPMPNSSLNSRASSPMVIPCRIGIGYWPTNDSYPRTSIGPSTALPPMGLGRSQTIALTPCFSRGDQAVGHRVDEGVDARPDVLQIDDQRVEAGEHLRRRLARFAVERIHGHAPDLVLSVPRFDHVVLDVGSEAVLRPEERRQAAPAGARRTDPRRAGAPRPPTPGCTPNRRASRRARERRAGARSRAAPACEDYFTASPAAGTRALSSSNQLRTTSNARRSLRRRSATPKASFEVQTKRFRPAPRQNSWALHKDYCLAVCPATVADSRS